MSAAFFEPIDIPGAPAPPHERKHYAYRPSWIKGQPLSQAPITVVVHRDRIAFLVTERLLEPVLEQIHGEVFEVFPGAHCFLDLPLGSNRHGELQRRIVELYHADEQSFIHLALAKKEQMVKVKPYPSDFSQVTTCPLDDDPCGKPPTFTKQRIFLDFLFDFYEQDHFHGHSYYFEVKAILDKQPIIQGIIAKHSYKYWLSNLPSDLVNTKAEELQFYQKKFKSAYDKWQDLLLENPENAISLQNGWFENPEEEMYHMQREAESKGATVILNKSKDRIEARIKRSRWHFQRLDYWNGFAALFSSYFRGGVFIVVLIVSLLTIMGLLLWGGLPKLWYQSGIWSGAIIMAVLSIAAFSRRLMRKNTPIDTSMIIELTKLPLIIGSSAVWVFVYTSDRFWDLDLDFFSPPKYFLVLISLMIAFSFLKNQINGYLEGHTKAFGQSIRRAGFGILLACLCSVITGLVLSTKFTSHALQKKDFLTNYFQEIPLDSLVNRLADDHTAADSLLELFYAAQNAAPDLIIDTVLTSRDSLETMTVLVQQSQSLETISDKQLFKEVLPLIQLPNRKQAVFVDIPILSSYQVHLRFLPHMILYYSFIVAAIGVLVELGYKRFK